MRFLLGRRGARVEAAALRYEAVAIGSLRRCLMAMAVQQIAPVAPLPWMLGVVRRLEVTTVLDRLVPPQPAHGLAWGRGGDALGLALLDGDQALYKVGKRLAERGLLALLQAGLSRPSRQAYRLGPILEALFAANLHQVLSALALQALAGDASPTPWLHQDPTTMAL